MTTAEARRHQLSVVRQNLSAKLAEAEGKAEGLHEQAREFGTGPAGSLREAAAVGINCSLQVAEAQAGAYTYALGLLETVR